MILDGLYEVLLAGGWVLFPIFLVGMAAFYILLKTFLSIGGDMYRRNFSQIFEGLRKFLSGEDEIGALTLLKKNPGLVSAGLELAVVHRKLSEPALCSLIRDRVGGRFQELERGLNFVSVLAVTAPLLGLLGTVTGMVHTFDIITAYGNSNPVLMAGGISEALLTTQSGLVIAFPLVLFRQRLQDRIIWLEKQTELGATLILNQVYRRNLNHG